ncbi:16S rRNA (adenine(1518)-N(6)/adenine(1519)-N(6))-dimethyltransferase RsmA [Candidatus Babeliales bacterium]|nr:16S rRNA (adenine(1518)-N(6)/adenine(1519)-N(6))-dimethyltransferase RsmA [Candidatus Babeliales bacterium]
MKKPQSGGITLKKHHGQYFLRDMAVVRDMLNAVRVEGKNIFEIGCGDGVLTREISSQKPERLWVFEIDPEWAEKVENEFKKVKNFEMFLTNVLDVEDSIFEEHKPWTLLSNLPYHVTFPILKKVQKNRDKITDGVVMVQEEVAQKIVKTSGRGYGYISLFFQHYFEWKLLTKISPKAFFPEPKVFSRLLHFVTKKNVIEIPDEVGFWKFIKVCFSQPRRTFRNNLAQSHFDMEKVPEKFMKLRAQQMSFSDLLELWKVLK